MSMNSARFRQRRLSGFTLLEVLVALSILAMSLGVLMQGFGDVSRTARTTQDYRRALMVAESQLAFAQGDLESGTVGYGGIVDERYRWKLSSSQFDDTMLLARLRANSPNLVTVEVSWGDGERSRSISLSTVRLGVDAWQKR